MGKRSRVLFSRQGLYTCRDKRGRAMHECVIGIWNDYENTEQIKGI